MKWLGRWRFAGRIAVRDIRHNRLSAALSVIAMAIPVSAVVAVAVVAPNVSPVFDDGTSSDSGSAAGMIAVAAYFAVLALLLVGAMVAAAMIVSVRRSERMLALLAATGAPRSMLARVMTARGLIFGAVTAGTSVVIGIAAGSAILLAGGTVITRIDVVAIVLVAIATIGVGWSASLTAAVRASGINVSTVLRDAPRPARSTPHVARAGRIVMLTGLGALLLGSALGIAGRALPAGLFANLLPYLSGMLAAPAAITILVGALLAFPAVIRWVGRVPALLPGAAGLAARTAARDAERSGARSGAAAASIMLVTFLVSSYLTFFSANDAWSVTDHDWQLQRDQVAVDLIVQERGNPSERGVADNPEAVASAVSDGVDATDVRVIDGVLGPFWGTPVDDDEGYSGRQAMIFPPDGLPQPQIATDGICAQSFEQTGVNESLCAPGPYEQFELSPTRPTIWVGDAADLELILGQTTDAATRAALAAGTVIVLDPRYMATDGSVTIHWWGAKQFVAEDEPGEFLPSGTPLSSVRLDGITVPMDHQVGYGLFLSPSAADVAGLVPLPARVLAQAPPGLSYTTVYATDLRVFSEYLFLELETGPSTGDRAWFWGAVMLATGLVLAIAIAAIGLSRSEGRQIDRTLAVLGAADGLRRRINGWYALFVVGTSCLIGTFCGVLLVLAFSVAMFSPPVIPVLALAIIGLGVPLVVALAARILPVRSQTDARRG